jgi:RNA polymerase sigma-70 factor (ECF subfamily)
LIFKKCDGPRVALDTSGREHELERALIEAKRAWPTLSVDRQGFIAHLWRHAGDDPEVLAGLRVGDLYLAFACAAGEPAAVAAFDQQYVVRVPEFVRRIDARVEFADEVAQQLRHKLLTATDGQPPKILEYAGRGALGAWLSIAAQRTALTLQRGESSRQRLLEKATEGGLGPGADPELDYLKARFAADFKVAFRTALQALSERERLVLRLHLVDGLQHHQIATLYGVNTSTVTRWLQRTRENLLATAQSTLCARASVSASEFQSLANLVQSQLDLSLATFLRGSPG